MTNQNTPVTLSLEEFDTRLKLMNTSQDFENTCKILISKYIEYSQLLLTSTIIKQGLICSMMDNDIKEIKINEETVSKIDFKVVDLFLEDTKDEEGNVNGKTIKLQNLNEPRTSIIGG